MHSFFLFFTSNTNVQGNNNIQDFNIKRRYIILNSPLFALVIQDHSCRSPWTNTANYFCGNKAVCVRATPLHSARASVALQPPQGRERSARPPLPPPSLPTPTNPRPPPHLPLPYAVTTGARARRCVTGACSQCPASGPTHADGAAPPAGRHVAPAA